jgi:hypothetical protein
MKITIDLQAEPPAPVAIRHATMAGPASAVKVEAGTLYAAGARASARFFNALLKLNRDAVRKSARRDRRTTLALPVPM